jgi:hypothetical protein
MKSFQFEIASMGFAVVSAFAVFSHAPATATFTALISIKYAMFAAATRKLEAAKDAEKAGK